MDVRTKYLFKFAKRLQRMVINDKGEIATLGFRTSIVGRIKSSILVNRRD